jgi:hypothetical protein
MMIDFNTYFLTLSLDVLPERFAVPVDHCGHPKAETSALFAIPGFGGS